MSIVLVVDDVSVWLNEERIVKHAATIFGNSNILTHTYTKNKAFSRFIKKTCPSIGMFVFVGKKLVENLLLPRMQSSPLRNAIDRNTYEHFAYEHYEDHLLCNGRASVTSIGVYSIDVFLNGSGLSVYKYNNQSKHVPMHIEETVVIPPLLVCAPMPVSKNMVFLTASWKSTSELSLFFVPENDNITVCINIKHPLIPVLTKNTHAQIIRGIRVMITGDINSDAHPALVPSNLYFANRMRYEYNRRFVSDTIIIERALNYMNVAAGDVFPIAQHGSMVGNLLVIDCDQSEFCKLVANNPKLPFGSKPEHMKNLFSVLIIDPVAAVVEYYGRNSSKEMPTERKERNPNETDISKFLQNMISSNDPDIIVCRGSFYELEDLLQTDLYTSISRTALFGSVVSGRLICFDNQEQIKCNEFMDYLCSLASFNGFVGNSLGTHHNRHIESSLQFICRRHPDTNALLFLSISYIQNKNEEGDHGGLNFSFLKNNDILENVWVVDFDSCFPSIIVTKSIGPPLKLIYGTSSHVLGKNELLSLYCQRLIGIRRECGESPYKNQYKLMSNICYGWFYATFNEVGQQIALESREALTFATAFFNMKKITVLSGHTDSLFLQHNATQDEMDAVMIEFNQELGKHYGQNSIMRMSIKGKYTNFLPIHLNAWAANNGEVHKGLKHKDMSEWIMGITKEILRFRFLNLPSELLWEILSSKIIELSSYTIATMPPEFFLRYEYTENVKSSHTFLRYMCSIKNSNIQLNRVYKYMWTLNHSKGKLVMEPFSEQEKKLKIDVVKLISTDINTILTQLTTFSQAEISGKLNEIYMKIPVASFLNNIDIFSNETSYCIHCTRCYSQLKIASKNDLNTYKNTTNGALCLNCNMK